MPDISAILKNKGISLADTNESKILSSLNGLFQRPVEPIHFSKLVSNKNQFYREKELEELADTILLLGGIAQNLLVRNSGRTPEMARQQNPGRGAWLSEVCISSMPCHRMR